MFNILFKYNHLYESFEVKKKKLIKKCIVAKEIKKKNQ